MKKILHFTIAFLTVLTFSAKSQISVTNLGTPYSQDFNSLTNTVGGTGTALPTGWAFLETGTNANTSYGVDIGSASGGNTYSYGAASNTERALGSLRSGSLQSVYGVNFTNNSGATINSLVVTYTGEQWRLGATGRNDSLNFQYSTDATSLATGTWTDENALDFISPVTSGTTGALNGNAVGNNTLITVTITGLNITNGSSFWLKWIDTDATGADDGLAIDDFNLVFNGTTSPVCAEPASQPTVLTLTPTPTTISGSFTASSPVVDQYLVVRSTASTLSASPVDGTDYLAGQAFGGGTIIAIGSSNSFVDVSLTANVKYYYFVFALNSEDCLGGPNYLSTSPLSNSTTTLPLPGCVAPTANATTLVLTPSNNTVTGNFTASASANRYLIVRSTSSALSTTPVNGTTYTAGQTLGGGTVVDYTTSTSFVATGLNTATTYYFFVFAANGDCSGEPFYRTPGLTGNTTTTNTSTGIPTGYYNAATGLTCAALKTALKTIIRTNSKQLTYTPGVWNAIKTIDLHRNDANTADIIWDIYTDNPTAAELYTFTPTTDQCGSYAAEGDCYNREHSFPQEWFGNGEYPMYSDLHHIFPVDGWINGKHDSNPYGEVATGATFTSKSNKSKLGPNSFGCYSGTVFEPIDAYKGDIARAQLYMITRYEDSMILWNSNGSASAVLNGTKYPALDDWYIQLLLKWHHLDPVSQKEIDRNNGIYALQANRNPFIDVPEFADQMFSCVTYSCVVPVKLIDFAASKMNQSVVVNWNVGTEINIKHYSVERSIDGANFTKVGEVAGAGHPSYSFADNNLPTSTIVYYRLISVDIDGKTSVSKIVTVRLTNTSAVSIFPNPAANNITIKLQQHLTANSILKITDVTGRTVIQKTITPAQNSFDLNIAYLAKGKYFVTIKNDAELIRESFIKVK